MDIKELSFTLKDNKIIDVEHDNLDVWCSILEQDDIDRIKKKATNFINGDIDHFRVWSDYDSEEASTDVYVAINKNDGSGLNFCIEDMENLIRYINHQYYDVYMVRIEDGLL